MGTKIYRILLGGLGGDSHSVGLHILHRALVAHGYRVEFLGTQNALKDFTRRAAEFDVVMISNMDGHAEHYLKDFQPPAAVSGHRALWFLGGNLTIGDAGGYQARFERQGFDRVFVKFVDLLTVLDHLAQALHGREPVSAEAADKRLGDEHFLREREEVLAAWPTGREAMSLEDNAAFLSRQPSFPRLLADVDAGLQPMVIQPRSGVPGLDEQIALFHRFRAAGAQALSYQVDSLTRNNRYAGAAEAIATSARTGRAVLNGFPVVNHGVEVLRRIGAAIGIPLQSRHSTRDPRLLAEISYAGGVTAFEGGPICYNIPYYKNYPLRDAIATWKYVDRLTGIYFERFGIPLDRELFGTLTATLIPPSIAIVTNLVEAVLAAQQGVKCVSLGYAEQGNRAQDIAAIRVMQSVSREVLAGLGHGDVAVHTVFHQYMAAFPQSEQRAEELIFGSSVTAGLARATRILTKTPAESRKIPTVEDNVRGLLLTRMGIEAARGRQVPKGVEDEAALLRREVLAIFESLLDCGHGDLDEGVVRGFELGLIDIPFAPSVHNRGEVQTARDVDGAVRYLRTGSLRLDAEVRDFHERKMEERRHAEGLTGKNRDYLLVESDVLRVPRELYQAWPLDSAAMDPAFAALATESESEPAVYALPGAL
ncbi:MAG TPA: methylaspartate mutase subunit E [Thermoanaerobaculia bacterium]|nr:methylaspartate mutase subunit E [Thermoanaerobaculia bacterium]